MLTKLHDNIPAKVMGDELKLTQVLLNLLGNAVKFTDEGTIEIECKPVNGNEKDKDYVAFAIKDTELVYPEINKRRSLNGLRRQIRIHSGCTVERALG
jgi:signal transduction histidine kinase